MSFICDTEMFITLHQPSQWVTKMFANTEMEKFLKFINWKKMLKAKVSTYKLSITQLIFEVTRVKVDTGKFQLRFLNDYAEWYCHTEMIPSYWVRSSDSVEELWGTQNTDLKMKHIKRKQLSKKKSPTSSNFVATPKNVYYYVVHNVTTCELQ